MVMKLDGRIDEAVIPQGIKSKNCAGKQERNGCSPEKASFTGTIHSKEKEEKYWKNIAKVAKKNNHANQ